jgi:hypothetical protein
MSVGMKRSETGVRLDDYRRAIIQWSNLSKKLGFKILVVENSSSIRDLQSKLAYHENPNLEFVQLREDLRSHFEGNSAGEFQMLREILEMGIISDDTDLIWKVTGRLYISNFNQLITKDSPDLILNRFYNPVHLVDTRIIGFSQKIFHKIFSADARFVVDKNQINYGNQGPYSSLEHLLTLETIYSELQGDKVEVMRKVPIYKGYSATSNKLIDGFISSKKKQIANIIRPLIIKLLAGSIP